LSRLPAEPITSLVHHNLHRPRAAAMPSFFTTQSIWLAVHRIFTHLGIEVGQSLALKDLMQAWGGTGLRQRDLGGALDTLARAGFVQLQMSPDGPVAVLLHDGFGHSREHAAATLDHLRSTRAAPPLLPGMIQPQLDGRRREDRPYAASMRPA
jgi:hypothetical protein